MISSFISNIEEDLNKLICYRRYWEVFDISDIKQEKPRRSWTIYAFILTVILFVVIFLDFAWKSYIPTPISPVVDLIKWIIVALILIFLIFRNSD